MVDSSRRTDIGSSSALIDRQKSPDIFSTPPIKPTTAIMTQITTESILKATCLCKQASISLHGPPVRSHYCHCTICQNFHSAPFSLNAIYPLEGVAVPDNSDDVFQKYTPKEQMEIYRCRQCGVAVCAWVGRLNLWAVYVGAGITLDGKRVRPSEVAEFEGVLHMFYEERQRDVRSVVLKGLEADC
jgi:hypothetical protein